jgi:DNA-binding MarR family transcriptional regulator
LLGMPSGLKIEKIAPIKVQISESTLVSVLTTDEIRELAGFKPLEKPLEVKTESRFSEEDLFWTELSKIGYHDDELEVISEKDLDYNPFDFADMSAIDSQIIDIVKANPKVTVEEIGQQVGETPSEVQERIDRLVKNGLLDLTKTKIKVTEEGEQEVSELITVYKYALRADLSGSSIIAGTRDFCRRMVFLSLNRSWTYDQIQDFKDSIAGSDGKGLNAQGTDLWSKRGGFWNRGSSTVPYCRHVWRARTVKVKKDAK